MSRIVVDVTALLHQVSIICSQLHLLQLMVVFLVPVKTSENPPNVNYSVSLKSLDWMKYYCINIKGGALRNCSLTEVLKEGKVTSHKVCVWKLAYKVALVLPKYVPILVMCFVQLMLLAHQGRECALFTVSVSSFTLCHSQPHFKQLRNAI